MTINTTPVTCSLLRRFAAIFYDCILLLAVLFFATFILLLLVADKAIESGNLSYDFYLLIISYLYFCWHWVAGGQTLGMRSWHIHVVNKKMCKPNWKEASLRFFSAIASWSLFAMGFIWSIFDKNKLALHDHLSGTKLIVLKTDINAVSSTCNTHTKEPE